MNTVKIISSPNQVVKVLGHGSVIRLLTPPDGIIKIVNTGMQGPAGPTGPTGPAGTGTQIAVIPAGTTITANQVCVIENGVLIPADPTNRAHGSLISGMALNGGTTSENINFVLSGGVTGFSGLNVNDAYFLGLDGSIGTIASFANSSLPYPSGSAWYRFVGQPISSSVLILQNVRGNLLN
jgi:hypothetical protein